MHFLSNAKKKILKTSTFTMSIIPRKLHGIIDYVWTTVMFEMPFLLGFASVTPAAACFFIAALSTLIISLFTNYEVGVWKRLPMAFHLDMDMALGLTLAISPWLFDFYQQVFWPHVLMGVFAIVAGFVSESNSLITNINEDFNG
ncbi:hypothetical protein ASG14_08240 [Pedobacter sp. Leaf194]|nr:hypothetical protein ASG14_08240 [Pedobacter sp. Leaf194]